MTAIKCLMRLSSVLHPNWEHWERAACVLRGDQICFLFNWSMHQNIKAIRFSVCPPKLTQPVMTFDLSRLVQTKMPFISLDNNRLIAELILVHTYTCEAVLVNPLWTLERRWEALLASVHRAVAAVGEYEGPSKCH